jgi:hypothetical protein
MFVFLKKLGCFDKPALSVALRANIGEVEPFMGFAYTVEEGVRLSRRSHTELPEFHGASGGVAAGQRAD